MLAACELGDRGERAAARAGSLWQRIDRHGRFSTGAPAAAASTDDEKRRAEMLQDYVPGQALLALARAAEVGLAAADRAAFDRAFVFYRHRFRHRRGWGAAGWLPQAMAAWWRVVRSPQVAAFAFGSSTGCSSTSSRRTAGS